MFKNREHKKRNRATLRVRHDMAQRYGFWNQMSSAQQDRGRATYLVIETGDLLLELLIATATDPEIAPGAKKEFAADAERLRRALDDPAAVERTWTFLAHALATCVVIRADEDSRELATNEMRAVRDLIALDFTLDEEGGQALELAPDAERLGYWTPEWMLTRHAFLLLVDEAVNDLRLFAEFGFVEARSLERAWSLGVERLFSVIDEGVLRG